MNILYVEDNRANAFIMRVALKDYNIVIAYDGEQGLESIRQEKFDLILMDINLGFGKMDGCEVMNEMRKVEGYSDTPFFAVTAYGMPDDEVRYTQREGFDDYFSKPIDFPALIKRIEDLKKQLVNK